MSDKRWRVRIYGAASTSLSTSGVVYQTTCLADPPVINGPILRPLQGRAEAQAWTLGLLDDGSSFTNALADSSGRLVMLRRICALERSLGGGAFTVQGSGRITDVALAPNIAAYQVTVEDERSVERTATLFATTNTTRLYPPGPHVAFGAYLPPPKGTITVQARSTISTKYALVAFDAIQLPLTRVGAEAMKRDLNGMYTLTPPALPPASSKGNWQHLRLKVGSRDYGVISFGRGVVGALSHPAPSANWLDHLDEYANSRHPVQAWVWATSSQLSLGQRYSSAFLHMFSAPPSRATPLHISASSGLSLVSMIKRVYDGTYSTAGTLRVRYSTAAIDQLRTWDWPTGTWRITDAALMADWLEQECYAPGLIAPLTDSQGRVAPVAMRLPRSTATTFTFTAANTREPYPQWTQLGREQVTRVRLISPTYYSFAFTLSVVDPAGPLVQGFEYGDTIGVTNTTQFLDDDRIARYGIRELRLQTAGLNAQRRFDWQAEQQTPWFSWGPVHADNSYAAWLRYEILHRFADGPLYGTLQALSTAEGVQPGDWVTLAIAQYPNPGAGRSGSRRVQILQRQDTVLGPQFQCLDGGQALSAPAAPTVTLSTSTQANALKATVGVAAGARWQLQLGRSTGAAPSSAAGAWFAAANGQTTSPVQLGFLPAGVSFYARANAALPNRVRSPWAVSTARRTVQTIAPPTGLASTSVGRFGFTAAWTPGDVTRMTDVHLDTATGATLSSANLWARLRIGGVQRLPITGLSSGTKYLCAVRHADTYGGFSSAARISVTTTTAVAKIAPRPLGLAVLLGAT